MKNIIHLYTPYHHKLPSIQKKTVPFDEFYNKISEQELYSSPLKPQLASKKKHKLSFSNEQATPNYQRHAFLKPISQYQLSGQKASLSGNKSIVNQMDRSFQEPANEQSQKLDIMKRETQKFLLEKDDVRPNHRKIQKISPMNLQLKKDIQMSKLTTQQKN